MNFEPSKHNIENDDDLLSDLRRIGDSISHDNKMKIIRQEIKKVFLDNDSWVNIDLKLIVEML